MRVDARAARSAVRADSDAVAQIMINLVDNAIKFAGEGAQRIIEVGARRGGGGMVVLFVRDFGPGVSPDQMKKIFQLFYRPESELTRETAGTGIGLAIVRELTVAMGGRVDCVNREPGAEFQVALPCVSDG
jgi:signal transduction histidine kinase